MQCFLATPENGIKRKCVYICVQGMESKDSNKLVEFADIGEVMHALVTGLKTDKTLMPCATAISLTVTLYQL